MDGVRPQRTTDTGPVYSDGRTPQPDVKTNQRGVNTQTFSPGRPARPRSPTSPWGESDRHPAILRVHSQHVATTTPTPRHVARPGHHRPWDPLVPSLPSQRCCATPTVCHRPCWSPPPRPTTPPPRPGPRRHCACSISGGSGTAPSTAPRVTGVAERGPRLTRSPGFPGSPSAPLSPGSPCEEYKLGSRAAPGGEGHTEDPRLGGAGSCPSAWPARPKAAARAASSNARPAP